MKEIHFKIDRDLYKKFKIDCVKKEITMADVFRNAVRMAIDLEIYDDLNKKEKKTK